MIFYKVLVASAALAWPFFGHDVNHSWTSPFTGPLLQPTTTWSINLGSSIESSPVIGINSNIYVGTRSSNLYCLDSIEGGSIKWVSKMAGCELSTPTLSNDSLKIFCGSLSGKFNSIDTETGKKIWEYDSGGAIWGGSTPSLSGSVIYFGSFSPSGGYIHAVNTVTGVSIWRSDTTDSVRAAPAIFENKLYIGDYSGRFSALSILTGHLLWQMTVADSIRSSASIINGLVLFGSYDNHLYALNATNGKQIWKAKTNNWIQASPAVDSDAGIVLVGSWDRYVYGFNLSNGIKLWSRNIGSAIWASAVIDTAGKAYVGSEGESENESVVTCMNVTNGRLFWKRDFNGSIEAASVIDNTGAIIIASGNGTIGRYI